MATLVAPADSRTNAPTVSVIIPAFNAETVVGRAVASALTQTHAPLEIIVVDDGSSDDIAGALRPFESRVQLLRKPNGGPGSARNLGASIATGEWLALLDADDWWHPPKLAAQLALATDPAVALVHCLSDHSREGVPGALDFPRLWQRNWICNSSVLLRRSVFEAVGRFEEARELISVEDYNLWLRIAAAGWGIRLLPELLVHYTTGQGLSSETERLHAASLHNIDRIATQFGLPAAMRRRKRLDTVETTARNALFRRKLPLARALYGQLACAEPHRADILFRLLVSLMPGAALDAARHWRERGNAPASLTPADASQRGSIPAPFIGAARPIAPARRPAAAPPLEPAPSRSTA